MNRNLAIVLDRLFIAMVLRKRRTFKEEVPEEAMFLPEKCLNEPELFYLPQGNPGLQLTVRTSAGKGKHGNIHRLCFKSPVTTPWPENNTLHAEYFRSHQPDSPHLVMLHGYQDAWNIFHRSIAGKLIRMDVSSLLLELPYHMRRAPKGTFNGEYFIYRGTRGVLQATRQAVVEACASVAWLKGNCCGRVGLLGSSLGGLVAALSCTVEPQIDKCILNVPALDMLELTDHSPAGQPVKKILDRRGEAAWAELKSLSGVITPGLLKPLLRKEDIMVIQASYDRFVPSQQVDRLRESWGDFSVKVLPQGHISTFVFAGKTVLREAANFITVHRDNS